MEMENLKIAQKEKRASFADDGYSGNARLSDEAIRSRLMASDLTVVSNVRALFEFAKLTEDKGLCLVARQKANDLAAKGSMEAYEIVKNAYLWLAPRDFDSYMIYLEWNRKPRERFYLPRRKQLMVAVRALQKLADDELDELFLSMPPRVGKTTLLMFYISWQIGRNSELSNLYCAYSDTITQAFYNGILEVLNDPTTYTWHEIFPTCQIAGTNSKNETLNIDRNKRYASLTCRSLYGTLNGACDVSGMLISDDLLSGIEEALNKDRLITAWGKVDNNMLSRAKGKAKILWCGTRWSMADPIGLRIDTVLNSDKFRCRRVQVINMPALNEKDESNFDYLYGVGFDTATYHMRRASFERNNDMASWNAQYMGEPIEREGTVFAPGDMRFFNGVLPDIPADRIFMPVDPAWGGGDYVASPICVKIANDLYVVDVVYDNSDKKVTQQRIAEKAVKWGVGALQIEATKTTASYAEGVQTALQGLGKRMTVMTKAAPQTEGGKAQRIFDKAPDIRDRMVFLADGNRSKEYSMFMQNVFAFKITGKNKHDDAPDSLAMAIDMDTQRSIRADVMGRLW